MERVEIPLPERYKIRTFGAFRGGVRGRRPKPFPAGNDKVAR